MVYVLNLGPGSVDIGGRCWVENKKYWVTKCELLEKTKFSFDNEDILFAYPQLDIHHYNGERPECNTCPEGDEIHVNFHNDEFGD